MLTDRSGNGEWLIDLIFSTVSILGMLRGIPGHPRTIEDALASNRTVIGHSSCSGVNVV